MNAMTQRNPAADEVIDVTVVDVDHLPNTRPVEQPMPQRDLAVGSAGNSNLILSAFLLGIVLVVAYVVIW